MGYKIEGSFNLVNLWRKNALTRNSLVKLKIEELLTSYSSSLGAENKTKAKDFISLINAIKVVPKNLELSIIVSSKKLGSLFVLQALSNLLMIKDRESSLLLKIFKFNCNNVPWDNLTSFAELAQNNSIVKRLVIEKENSGYFGTETVLLNVLGHEVASVSKSEYEASEKYEKCVCIDLELNYN